MNEDYTPVTIVVADDDPDDRLLIEDAFKENKIGNKIEYVEDGEELLDYLRREGKWEGLKKQPLPGLILLDLNMPRMDGREALKQIKGDERFQQIPVVVLTTSSAEEDVARTYCSGVNSFIPKPVTFEGLVEIIKTISAYWIKIVHLPNICVR